MVCYVVAAPNRLGLTPPPRSLQKTGGWTEGRASRKDNGLTREREYSVAGGYCFNG